MSGRLTPHVSLWNYKKYYLKEIPFKIIIALNFQSYNTGIISDLSWCFGLGWVGSAILAFKAHNDEIFEVRNTGLTHFHLARNFTGVARDIENYRLLFHKVIFLERFCEVDFGTNSLGFNLLNLLFSIFFTISHGSQLLESSFDVCNF